MREILITLVCAVFASTGFWAFLTARLAKMDKHKDAVSNALVALLRDRIVHLYQDYTEKGFCTVTERENVNDIYTAYHDLGGNDIATDLFDKIMKMPTAKGE